MVETVFSGIFDNLSGLFDHFFDAFHGAIDFMDVFVHFAHKAVSKWGFDCLSVA